MIRVLYYSASFLLLDGCAKQPVLDSMAQLERAETVKAAYPEIATAISQAPPASKKVLHKIDEMMTANEVIVGGCWDYLNEAFNRAGYPYKHRNIVFKEAYKGGRYANSDLILPGDWLYYVNHSYNDIEHSGLFISWVDKAKYEALIFSYAGEGRKNPARMSVYHIDQVYQIIRAKN